MQAKNDFAKNLSNIAHQIKTPITAISLSVQMMKQELAGCFGQLRAKEPETGRGHLEQVEKQLCGSRIWRRPCLCCPGWTPERWSFKKIRWMCSPFWCWRRIIFRSCLSAPALH